MSDMFEYLEVQAREENLPFKNSAAIAIDRAERRFGSFVESAKGEKEFRARVELVADEIIKIAKEACEEYGYDDPQHIAKLVLGQMQILAEAKPESGGEADERQKLPTMKADGYYTEPTVALNPNSAGDHIKNTNPPIPELTPDDKQNPPEKAWPWDAALETEGDGLDRTKVTDQKPEQVGPSTQTFPNKGQADPVTAAMNWNNSDMDEEALLNELEDEAPIYADTEDLDNDYRSPEVRRQNSIDVLRAGMLKEDYGPDDEVDYGLSSDKTAGAWDYVKDIDLKADSIEDLPEEDEQFAPEYSDVPMVGYNSVDDLEDPSLYEMQQEMDAPYNDMTPPGFDRGLRRWNDSDTYDKARLHTERTRPDTSYWDDSKNWKGYRDQQYKPTMAKSAAERMDFNALSEMMTPSDAVGKLVEAGMPEHEAKDRIDFYVNHVDPGWAHKSWTSSTKESIWDTSDPQLLDMSYEVDAPSVEAIQQVYNQYANSDRFETPQEAVNALFSMYAENAAPDEIMGIASMFEEAIGMMPSNIQEVEQHVNRFASQKEADAPGIYRDISQMQEGVLERNVDKKGNPLEEEEKEDLKKQILEFEEMGDLASKEYYGVPGMDIEEETEDMEDMISPSVKTNPTKNIPVKYKMTNRIYQSFLKKQAESN